MTVAGIDHDRAQVYAAELAAFAGTGFEVCVALDRLVELAGRLFAGPWWPCGAIEIRMARSDARSSVTRWVSGSGPVIRLAEPQMTMATLAHELAHVLAGSGHGHDATFRQAHLDVVEDLFGPAQGEWLAEAYRTHGLHIGQRLWPGPPARGGGGAIAL